MCNDLKALGIEPGRNFAVILRRLRNAWLNGEVSKKEEEETLLKSLISDI